MIKTGFGEIPNLYGLIAAITKKESSSQYLADLQEIRKAYAQGVKENYSNSRVTQQGDGVKQKVGLDSEANQLTAEQETYFANSQARDATGKLLVLYHQTDESFTVFDPRRTGAGSTDSETPFGIFLKRTDRDIGLKGKVQMPLYANITNPLRAENREDLVQQLKQMSEEYANISDEMQSLNDQYNEKHRIAKEQFINYLTEWRKKNPEASRKEIYNDSKFNELYEAEDAVIDEWSPRADALSVTAKETILKTLRASGYDGIFLAKDSGSFGRETDAIIALDSNQVKSVQNKTPSVNPDIRYKLPVDAKSPTYEELIFKDPIAVVDVSRNVDGLNYADHKKQVLENAETKRLFDAPYLNRDTEISIFLTPSSFTYAFSNLTADFGVDTILAMDHIDEILYEAVLTHIDTPKNPAKAESRVFTFFAAIEGENGIEPIKLKVKEYVEDNFERLPRNIRNYFEKNGLISPHNRLYGAVALEVIAVEKAKKSLVLQPVAPKVKHNRWQKAHQTLPSR